MDAAKLLENRYDEILDDATERMVRSHLKHYETSGSEQLRERLRTLSKVLLESLRKDSDTPMIRFAEKIGDERFSTGFALSEVQTAFNVLEEAIWNQILSDMGAGEYAHAIESVNRVLRTGKDAVARTYFSRLAPPPWDQGG